MKLFSGMRASLAKADEDGKVSRASFVAQAALEYLISLLFTDYYLSALMTAVNIPNGYQGIINSLTYVCYVVELLAVLLIRKRIGIKKSATVATLISQIAFIAVYFTPFFGDDANFKSLMLVLFFVLANVINKFFYPFREMWFMSNVNDSTRGSYSAIREIISLASGYVFTFVMGRVLDAQEEGSAAFFLIAAATCFGLTLLHLVSMLLIKEGADVNPENQVESTLTFGQNLKRSLSVTFGSKRFRKVVPVFLLYYAGYSVTNFFGSYKLNVLGFTGTFNSFLVLLMTVLRSSVSIPFGKIADKKSWPYMMKIVLAIASVGFIVNFFTVPTENGVSEKIMYSIFYGIFAIAMGGMNSGMVNIVYDYVDHKDRADALAWVHATGGLSYLLVTTAESFLTNYLEANEVFVFGRRLYYLPAISVISVFFFVLLIAYIQFFLSKKDDETPVAAIPAEE